LVGRLIQRRQQHAASDAAELLYSLAPASARLVENGAARDVPIEALELGALVEVRAGDCVPVDGTVVGGCSAIDASLLTGESQPADVAVGDSVHAGTINLSARLLVRVEQTGESTRVGRLLDRMKEARRRRAPVVVLADRLAGRFVVVALALAALTLGIWLALDPEHAVDHAVALLVVTCPCALGMATPLAVTVALGRAARHGILVKGGDTLEACARRGLIVFDKTGTLTEGKLRLLSWQGPEALKRLVLSLEAECAHPIARAFARAFEKVAPIGAQNVVHALGGGVCGDVAGQRVAVGAAAYVARMGVTLDAPMLCAIEQQSSLGRTPVVVAVDGRAQALAAFGDPVRRDAVQSLRRLRDLGYELAISSGDHPRVVAAVAAELGVPFARVMGGATPEAKLDFIQQQAARETVLMVGDGVNDAAALSAATVGIAVHGGAEASLDAADVFLTQGGLSPIVSLLEGARRTLAVIRRSIGFSLAYNVVGVALAMSGVLSPLIAALMMPMSSLSVLASSLLSRTFPKPAAPPSERGQRLSVAEVAP
jgi:Cu2+-exporting ATPase